VEARAERWTTLLAQGKSTGFKLVAEDGDQVAGFCSVVTPARDEDLGPRACEVAAIYVDPSRWRSGVGTSLLDAAVGRLDDGRWDEGDTMGARGQPASAGLLHQARLHA
jgi:GNAT superfamily N-acetyltransferase